MEGTGNEKYVFISDVHLGDQNSYQPAKPETYPYGWTNKHVKELESFLKGLDDHEETRDANKVMIVGDLVDTWVCPSALNPPSFDDVLGAKHNKDVISALNSIADAGKLMYIPGNHDMLIDQKTLHRHIQNLEMAAGATGHVKFYGDLLVAEHGHEYCLFDAVDSWSRHQGRLPMGIFISQLAAEGTYEKNDKTNYREILEEFIKKFSPGTVFAQQVIAAIRNYEEKDVGVSYTDPFLMGHMDYFGAEISYDNVVKIYGDIFDQWDKKSGSGIPATLAVAGDGGMLRPAADLKYLLPGLAKIVLFGHTHKYEIKKGLLEAAEPENSPQDSSKASVIYGNCGTWIDSKECNFIVTEKCTINGEHRIYVRGYAYSLSKEKAMGNISGPLDEAYIVV
jgi:UDP-2,3-diacylglucosamine pyrophosphatase LpxH